MNRYIDENGFSLVEVIVSIAILGILIIPISTLMITNLKSNSESRKQIIATNLAESKIEELKFSKTIKLGKITTEKDGFTIDSLIEHVNLNKLYRITVEVKKDDKIIERLLTYKNSLERSDSN